MKQEQNSQVVLSNRSRTKQLWAWWRDKVALVARTPWYASYLLRQFYQLMKAIKPSKQVVASTVTGAALVLVGVAPIHALGITVNSTEDVAVVDDGQCTLREALVAANTNLPSGVVSGECTTGATGTDTIDLTTISGTIALSGSNLPFITNAGEHIVLNGPGAANLTIDGGGTFRTIFSNGIGNDVTVDGLTITGSGASQSGIFALNNITVTNSSISGNTYNGVQARDGTVSVTNSSISGNSQNGIYAQTGTVSVTNSSISGNNSNGIYAYDGSTRVTNSAVFSNGRNGVYSKYGTISVTNSVVSGNGIYGVYTYDDHIAVTNSTVTGNTRSGVSAYDYNKDGAVITLTNSLVVGNNGGAGDVKCESFSASFSGSSSNNLVTDKTGCAAIPAGQITTAPITSIIASLADNGGDTKTHALVSGSPAINAGSNTFSPGSTDQRGVGFPRIVSGIIDIGSYEFSFDLQIAKAVTPTINVLPGQIITYTLTFTNAGPDTVSGVIITDIIPISVTNSSVISSGVVITQTASGYVWNVQDLVQNKRGIITITGQISNPLATGMFTNTAIITATSGDSNTTNNSSSVGVTVGGDVSIYLPIILKF